MTFLCSLLLSMTYVFSKILLFLFYCCHFRIFTYAVVFVHPHCIAIDQIPPEINCPGDQLVQAPLGLSELFVSWTAVTATDDSGQTPQFVSSSPPSLQGLTGGIFDVGRVTTVQYIYQDTSGNMNVCRFDVTVNGK